MLWVVLALLGAFFTTTHFALFKKYQQHIPYLILMTGAFLCNALLLLSFSLLKGIPEIKPGFWGAIVITTILNIVASVLYYRALEKTDFSLAQPLLSLTPVFLIISSYFILGERASWLGIVGVLLTVIGVYILSIEDTSKTFRWWHPFQQLFSRPNLVSILVVSIIFGISSSYDKVTVETSDPFFSSAVVYILLGITFLIITLKKYHSVLLTVTKTSWPKFLITGGTLTIVAIFINYAFLLQFATYVLAVKRLSILFSLIYAKKMFQEKQLRQRLIASSFMVVGTVLIIFAR